MSEKQKIVNQEPEAKEEMSLGPQQNSGAQEADDDKIQDDKIQDDKNEDDKNEDDKNGDDKNGNNGRKSGDLSSSSSSTSYAMSGYERDSNECTEFCIDLIGCFGLFDSCCPSTGEGFVTNVGIFCANIMLKCVKCS